MSYERKSVELLQGMTSNSKKGTYKCEKELCEILTDICNKHKERLEVLKN